MSKGLSSNTTVTKEKATSYQLLVSNSKPIRLQDWLGLTNHSLGNVLAAFRLQHSPLFAADSQPQNISDPSEKSYLIFGSQEK